MPGSQASASQEQGSAQVQAALAELEWAQVLESQAGPESQERESAEKAQTESARQEQQADLPGPSRSSAHTHARSRRT